MSILHIEDLPIEEFIKAVRNLNEFDITEKVDGFHIRFGIDDNGFYTSGKDEVRKYKISDYSKEFRYSGFKSAHMALARVLPKLLKLKYLQKGDEIEAEVLFGHMPNTVPYDGESNKLIMLRKKKGAPDLKQIKELLDKQEVAVTLDVPITTDGKTINWETQNHNWIFSKTPSVSPLYVTKVQNDIEFERRLSDLEEYLYDDSGIASFTNAELLALPLNKKPSSDLIDSDDWKTLKDVIKDKKALIRSHVLNHKLEIKSQLISDLVQELESDFGPSIEDGGWIEGLVFSNDNMQFKLVDKDVFTTLNQFNWHIRGKLVGHARGLNDVESIVSKIKVGLATELGHPELGTNQKKRYVDSNSITSAKLAKEIKDFHATRDKMAEIVKKGLIVLNKYHTLYNKYKMYAKKEIKFGKFKRVFKIDKHIDEKNLEAFAELFDVLKAVEQTILAAKDRKDLVKLVLDTKADLRESVKWTLYES